MKRIILISLAVFILLPSLYFIFNEYIKINSKIDTSDKNLEISLEGIDQLNKFTAYQSKQNNSMSERYKSLSKKYDLLEENQKQLRDLITTLEKRISKLKIELTNLQKQFPKKLSDLESSNKWKYRTNWRKIKNGLREDSVTFILGEPTSIKGGDIMTYEYGTFMNRGYLLFDHGGKVYSWNEPTFDNNGYYKK